MTIYLVRHAHAGQREAGFHDQFRPLSKRGWIRAAELQTVFAQVPLAAVWSSAYTRCVQTVEPVAFSHQLVVVERNEFGEDATAAEAIDRLEQTPSSASLVVCSHGNLIPEIIDWLVQNNSIRTRGRGCEKGSIWALERNEGGWFRATYLAMANTPILAWRAPNLSGPERGSPSGDRVQTAPGEDGRYSDGGEEMPVV